MSPYVKTLIAALERTHPVGISWRVVEMIAREHGKSPVHNTVRASVKRGLDDVYPDYDLLAGEYSNLRLVKRRNIRESDRPNQLSGTTRATSL